MRIRAAKPEEFEPIRAFYWSLIDRMQTRKDTVGWKKGIYPADAFLRESLEKGELFVLDGSSANDAAVILNSSGNEGYAGVLWGVDCSPEEVLVPHALAVDPARQGQGIGTLVMRDILELAAKTGKKTVRLDILNGNTAAERLYVKAGFCFVQAKTMFYADTGWTEFSMYEYVLPSERKIIAACGNDCAACPRYVEPPYVKSEEALAHTAELWFRIGYRDRTLTAAEIACRGCREDTWCRYRIVRCVREKHLEHCGQCSLYPCETVRECFAVTGSFIPACRSACTENEFARLEKAFFEKEKNLDRSAHENGRSGRQKEA